VYIQSETDQRLGRVPSEEFFNGFVTWSALEDGLRGLRADALPVPAGPAEPTATKPVDSSSPEPIESSTVIERTAVEAGRQADPVSRH